MITDFSDYLYWRLKKHLLKHPKRHDIVKQILGPVCFQQILMYGRLGYWPNVRNPSTFNEWIIHRKALTDDPRFAIVEDKVQVRDYVCDRVCDDILPEVYWIGTDVNNVPFTDLPKEYVVKPNHMAGRVIFVDSSPPHPKSKIQRKSKQWLSEEFGIKKGQYWHADIPRRIIIEERLSDGDGNIPNDYKFYVFDGRVEYIHVDTDRFGKHTRRFYDREWNPQSFELEYPLGPIIKKPDKFQKMIQIAERLGEDFNFIRVDLYEVNGDVVFGEMTPSPGSGGEQFHPVEWDYRLGSLWSESVNS